MDKNRFAVVDQLLNKLNFQRTLTEGELMRLRDEFVISYTYHSNAIEGNTLTLQETALVLNEGITIDKKPLKDHLEVVGHKEAYLYVEELVKDKISLSERVIKDIHCMVMLDRRDIGGIYRRVPVSILGAVHTPPQPYIVQDMMEELIVKNNKMASIHVIERVALFHLEFESIHPFVDGNGGKGRLLINLELMIEGVPLINIKFGDRKRYFECFTKYHTKENGSSGMVDLITELLEEELIVI